ncbi:MAG TPA: PEGA domain-containing protein [Planctomycetota bacterium]
MRTGITTMLAVLFLGSCLSAEEPDAVYKQGITKLRDAQADHSALVPATKLLAQAAALYEAAGDEAKCAEVNSCIFWAKKKMTLADTEAVKGDAAAVQRIEAAIKIIPVSEAKVMLDKAEAFAKGRADDPLLVSIRFFEIADRFPDAPEGKKAMQQSLAAMQKVGEKAKLETYKPAPTDGKAFIKSEPAGAAIILVNADGGKMDTGKATPALVQLPVGRQSLELTLKGRKPAIFTVEVDGKTIAKPDAATMEPLTIPVDVIFDEGWTVFVDGKCTYIADMTKAETPCTVSLPLGTHELGLGKEGFLDIKQRIEILDGGLKTSGMPTNTLTITNRPSKGTSGLVKAVRSGEPSSKKIVIWNSHNARYVNGGAHQISLTLYSGEKAVFKKDAEIEWSATKDCSLAIPVDNEPPFDRVRVTITKWEREHPSLSEIEVLINGKNMALGKAVKCSGSHQNGEHRDSWKNINDGITSSNRQAVGYWLAPPFSEAWIEIDLTKSAEEKPRK